MKRKSAKILCLVPALFIVFFSLPAPAKAKTRVGVGGSFSMGASIPKGDLWGVNPRTNMGFSLSAGLRVLFGHSCTEPTLFFVPAIVDTKKKGGRNGSFLSVLLGMQVYPYNILFVRPYFMFAAGFGWISYEGPSTAYGPVNPPEQSGNGKGVPILVGGGIDFNLYKGFSIGPTFFWNPVWWADCSREISGAMGAYLCNPAEDRWILKFWFAGLRVSFNFPE